jgi:hypothetical protein
VLQDRRPPHQHVDADPIAGRHLVYEPAEIPLQFRHPSVQLIAPPGQIDHLIVDGRDDRPC